MSAVGHQVQLLQAPAGLMLAVVKLGQFVPGLWSGQESHAAGRARLLTSRDEVLTSR